MGVRTIRHAVSNKRARPQVPHPMTHPSLFCVTPPAARFPVVAGHFSLQTYPLKSDDAHLTFAMVP